MARTLLCYILLLSMAEMVIPKAVYFGKQNKAEFMIQSGRDENKELARLKRAQSFPRSMAIWEKCIRDRYRCLNALLTTAAPRYRVHLIDT